MAKQKSTTKPEIIFFGNGDLADFAKETLSQKFEIIFHAKTKADLATACEMKQSHPKAHAILASYGVLIKPDVLDLFEPEGIINLHPSLLPKYRGPSPIETAILNGDEELGISIIKLTDEMDAGPLYYQESLHFDENMSKQDIYRVLAQAGARWLANNLDNLPPRVRQDDAGLSYTKKLDKSMSELKPAEKSARELKNQIRAFAGFPKSKYVINGQDCTIHEAHISDTRGPIPELSLECQDGKYLIIDTLQPAGKKPMPAAAFKNGYLK